MVSEGDVKNFGDPFGDRARLDVFVGGEWRAVEIDQTALCQGVESSLSNDAKFAAKKVEILAAINHVAKRDPMRVPIHITANDIDPRPAFQN